MLYPQDRPGSLPVSEADGFTRPVYAESSPRAGAPAAAGTSMRREAAERFKFQGALSGYTGLHG